MFCDKIVFDINVIGFAMVFGVFCVRKCDQIAQNIATGGKWTVTTPGELKSQN